MGKSLLDDIKNQVKKSGANKGKIMYFASGVKTRIRFLQDMEDGMKILFHDSFEKGINVPCQEIFGKSCSHCDDEDLRHRDQYLWSVWDYEAKETKIILAAVNNCSPVPALVGMYETYGTLTDRDYVITKNGKGQSTSYTVVPMDKARFRNEKAKPFSESKTLSILNKAFPDTDSDDEDEDVDDEYEEEEDKPKKNKKKAPLPTKNKKGKKHKDEVEEDEEEDEDFDDEDTEDEVDYSEMSAKELYKLCRGKEIKVKPKMDKEYYIEKLEEEDEEDDW